MFHYFLSFIIQFFHFPISLLRIFIELFYIKFFNFFIFTSNIFYYLLLIAFYFFAFTPPATLQLSSLFGGEKKYKDSEIRNKFDLCTFTRCFGHFSFRFAYLRRHVLSRVSRARLIKRRLLPLSIGRAAVRQQINFPLNIPVRDRNVNKWFTTSRNRSDQTCVSGATGALAFG